MKDKPSTPHSFIKMEESRRLMDQGHPEESLILALEALLQELDHLRSSLQALEASAPAPFGAAPRVPAEHPSSAPHWLPPVKPRVLH